MKTYKLEVGFEQLQTIAAGLNELPRKHSQPVFDLIQSQVTAQEEAEKKAAEEAAKKVAAPVKKPKLEVIEGGKAPEDPSQ